ncbi:hypothetical protein [Elizabethkingia meningoseptica]|uniref:hypothetical protein n=1 Tax=Elizabethkingia meningoseptica TaxID=238 RepID=UPI0038925E9F
MKRLKIVGILLSLTFVTTGVYIYTSPDIIIIHAEYNPGYQSVYPPECFIKYETKKYLISDVYIYKKKLLREYRFTGSEGFAVKKLSPLRQSEYNSGQKIILNYQQSLSEVKYNATLYHITAVKEDTIFSETSPGKMVLFITKNQIKRTNK